MAKKTERSLRLSAQGIQKANTALTKFSSVADLAAQIGAARKRTREASPKTTVGMSRGTIYNFLKGEPVQRKEFHEICKKLGLDWREIADLPTVGESQPVEKNQESGSDIDELVQEVRSRACEKIKTVYGTMRMLRVNRPVPVDDIYIELNVLEQVSCDRTFSDWRRDFQPDWRSFDRLGLGQAIKEGVPALDIVREYPKLMAFGKPGSGKTTFLKSLATRCIDVERQLQWNQKDYVPIFITLKSFAKDARKRGDFSLFDYIYQREFCSWGEKNQQVVESILEQGRAVVLLDGLDEVQGQEYELVIEEVESFCEYFHRNRFLITCRTQSQKYKFEGFTDVEVADFKPEQVNRFINRWFAVVVENAESENLAAELIGQLQQPQNQQIAELAVTPVLLSLICFVFCGGKGNLPKNRADLYKKGLRDLLEGLDESKGVQREPAYEDWTPEAEEKLLTYLAATLFEANDYFPEQERLEKLISEHLDISPSNATKVLKSLEEQSGLIVERSEGFWSFSHLTFQEYFTAKWFCDRADCEGLVSHITEKQWREVFFLAGGMMGLVDKLLHLMKKVIDLHIASDEELQQFLSWLSQKSNSVKLSYKPGAIRAFYLSELNSDINIDLSLDESIDSGFKNLILDKYSFFDADFDSRNWELILDSALHLDKCPDPPEIALALVFAPELGQALQELSKQVSERHNNREKFGEWWRANSQAWREKYRYILIKYRNIGHKWQFSSPQKRLLEQYCYANSLLVDCMNSSGVVSDEVRQEIEETLLLPIIEIKQRQEQLQVTD